MQAFSIYIHECKTVIADDGKWCLLRSKDTCTPLIGCCKMVFQCAVVTDNWVISPLAHNQSLSSIIWMRPAMPFASPGLGLVMYGGRDGCWSPDSETEGVRLLRSSLPCALDCRMKIRQTQQLTLELHYYGHR